MYGWHCGELGSCKGRVHFKDGDIELYAQRRYFATLIDIEKILMKARQREGGLALKTVAIVDETKLTVDAKNP